MQDFEDHVAGVRVGSDATSLTRQAKNVATGVSPVSSIPATEIRCDHPISIPSRVSRGSTLAATQAAILRFQRSAGNAGVTQLLQDESDPHGLKQVLGSGGSPLDTTTRATMESSFGTDFSDVRIHTDADAASSAKSLGAHAYTTGSDVVFAAGQYDPSSDGGQKTIAHELTHVVQQRSGPVDGTDTGTGVSVSHPSDPYEQAAVATADQFAATNTATSTVSSSASTPSTTSNAGYGSGPGSASSVQLDSEDESLPMQGLFIQREGEEQEEEEGVT